MKPDQTVYAVFREGIRRHECGGVFTDLAAAEESALLLINAEPDDYHTYAVHSFALNRPAVPVPSTVNMCWGITESPSLVRFKRRGPEVIRET